MNLLQRIYDLLTAKAKEEAEKSRKAKELDIIREYNASVKAGSRSKYDYSAMCKSLKRNNDRHAMIIQRKTARWEWLKKLT